MFDGTEKPYVRRSVLIASHVSNYCCAENDIESVTEKNTHQSYFLPWKKHDLIKLLFPLQLGELH